MPSRRSLAATLIAAFLAVQVAIPVIALLSDRPARFGWQMYAAFPQLPDAWLIHADGSEEPVDLTDLFAVRRAEIDYAAALRDQLCSVADAAAVRVVPAEGDAETVPCE